MISSKKTLSKSKFIAGLQCPKRLYLELHHRELAAPPSSSQERIFSMGHQVGELAQIQFEGGFLIEANHLESEKALLDTKEAITNGHNILFEPAFIFDDIFVRLDAFVKTSQDAWDIYEVKASSKVSDTYIADVGVQRWVSEKSVFNVENCFIMHINTRCSYPNLDNFFIADNVTVRVNRSWPELKRYVQPFRDLLIPKDIPDIPIGKHCDSPYSCHFKEYCWQNVKIPSIFTIPRINRQKVLQLISKNIYSILDIPKDFPFSESQRRYVDIVQSKKPQIFWPAIKDELDKLVFPLYFLDFETQMDAVTKYDGLHPFETYPFQYSLHILDKDGNLSHKEYLHTDDTDPRLPIAEHLTSDIGTTGKIIAYDASYEKRVISTLAIQIP